MDKDQEIRWKDLQIQWLHKCMDYLMRHTNMNEDEFKEFWKIHKEGYEIASIPTKYPGALEELDEPGE